MNKVIELPKPSDVWQFTVDVVRRPDGQIVARLVDCRTSLIESGQTDSSTKLHEIAKMLTLGVEAMRADAEALSS